MVTGPQQQRLDQALTGASPEAISTGGSAEWNRCAQMLSVVAEALDRAGMSGQELGGQTGPAISAAFAQTAVGMSGKARELARGAEALSNASNALIKARVGQTDMNRDLPQEPHPGPYVPPVDDDVTAKGTYKGELEAYETSFHAREERARQLADALDTDFQASTDTMKSIHGEPDPPIQNGGGDGGGGPRPISVTPPSGGGRPPTGGHHPVGVVGEPVRDPDHHGQHGPELSHHTTTPITTAPVTTVPPTHVDPPAVGLHPDQGTVSPSGTTGVIGSPSGTGGISGPLAGGLGVVAGGGLAGAAIGGLRGGLVPTGSVPGAAARPIGSSSRAGAPGALGRGGAAGTGSPTSRPTGRGAGGRGGLGGGGRGGAAGAGGGAGGRRGGAAGAGAAAGRRGGKKDQDEHSRDRDLFDDGQDWIDDAEAAPGVID